MANSKGIAVGIDLGTTYSCVAVTLNGKTEVCPFEGARTTPSVVGFGEEEVFVGENAKSMPGGESIYGIKRIIGKRYYDHGVAEDVAEWPFSVVADTDGRAAVETIFQNEMRRFLPEFISAQVLSKMKEAAETFLCHEVSKAVITVPAYFNDGQRQATVRAGQIIGLEVVRIVNEPTAAALAYAMQHPSDCPRCVLIFDLGGGTFDVSVVSIDKVFFTVKGTAGDTHLGGEDFTRRMVEMCMEKLNERCGVDFKHDAKVNRKLREACEKAKRVLASNSRARICAEGLQNGDDFTCTITRSDFEALGAGLFDKIRTLLERLLDDVDTKWKITKDDIESVILVGGSTRIPMVHKIIADVFGGEKIFKGVNPDEIVACGAAVLAASLAHEKATVLKDVWLVDVTPLSLGIEDLEGKMCIITPRNTPLPREIEVDQFQPPDAETTSVIIPVYEGEDEIAKNNHFLGEFVLGNIPKGQPPIAVKFEIDEENLLHVSACVVGSDAFGEITIDSSKRVVDVQRMIEEAEQLKTSAGRGKENADALNDLSEHVNQVLFELKSRPDNGSKGFRQKVEKRYTTAQDWVSANGTAQKTVIDEYFADLKNFRVRVDLEEDCMLAKSYLKDEKRIAELTDAQLASMKYKLAKTTTLLEENANASTDDLEQWRAELKELIDSLGLDEVSVNEDGRSAGSKDTSSDNNQDGKGGGQSGGNEGGGQSGGNEGGGQSGGNEGGGQSGGNEGGGQSGGNEGGGQSGGNEGGGQSGGNEGGGQSGGNEGGGQSGGNEGGGEPNEKQGGHKADGRADEAAVPNEDAGEDDEACMQDSLSDEDLKEHTRATFNREAEAAAFHQSSWLPDTDPDSSHFDGNKDGERHGDPVDKQVGGQSGSKGDGGPKRGRAQAFRGNGRKRGGQSGSKGDGAPKGGGQSGSKGDGAQAFRGNGPKRGGQSGSKGDGGPKGGGQSGSKGDGAQAFRGNGPKRGGQSGSKGDGGPKRGGAQVFSGNGPKRGGQSGSKGAGGPKASGSQVFGGNGLKGDEATSSGGAARAKHHQAPGQVYYHGGPTKQKAYEASVPPNKP